ncbi:MAG TPA: hypothetical protein ENJ28_05425 [Gammaproteobacteria bacterium]|nr:hypothetical protein [Gammaproteobacteria bacterium]
MQIPNLNPVDSEVNLRGRVDRLFRETSRVHPVERQVNLGLAPAGSSICIEQDTITLPWFLDFVTDALPSGDVYLFGGVLRDLALSGKKGFNSDVDLVVEGDWDHLVAYLRKFGAELNKFGGYRLAIGEWPVDIWHAESTWAIRHGLVKYQGISSLTATTVLNWDAILMNWRTKSFIFRHGYFEDIGMRRLDIVLEENPNPLGMLVRVLRHLYLKDAMQITIRAVRYIAKQTKIYSYKQLKDAELKSYKNSIIEHKIYNFFHLIDVSDRMDIRTCYEMTGNILEKELENKKSINICVGESNMRMFE